MVTAGVIVASSASAQSSAPQSRQTCLKAFEDAQLEQKRGKLVLARKLFNDCSEAACPSQLREDCSRKQDELDKATPTATFVVRDAADNEISNALVKIDGTPLSVAPGHALPIDPAPTTSRSRSEFGVGGAGLVALGVGVAWYILDRPSSSSRAARHMSPSIGANRAGGSLTLSF
jgi:hypothetical protein